jgi:peptidoglycan-associated lipoprotein
LHVIVVKKQEMPIFVTALKEGSLKNHCMKIAKLIVLSCVALFFSLGAISQTTKKADVQFANRGYYEAAKLYKVAEPATKALEDKARIFFQLGECYRLVSDYQSSLEWYEKAITAQYNNTNPEVHFNYGLSLLELERWDDATAQFNKYITKGGEKSKANARIKSAQDAAAKKAAKTKVRVENVVELNSPFFDYCLTYSSKKADQIVFSSSRQASSGTFQDPITGESFMDLFTCEQDKKGKWGTPQPVSGEVNTSSNEGAACFSKDYSEMFYTYCKYESDKAWFACDIMRSTRNGEKFTQVSNLNVIDRAADDTSVVGHPCISSDGKYLLFASDMAGGKGGKDLWYISFDKANLQWTKPVNLSAVNSKGDDMFPYLAEDGTLYFSSDGHAGLGGLDIFKAQKNGDMVFGAPAALDYPINSSSNDFALIMEAKKEGDKSFSGYFTSNRPGGKGKDDIYRFSEPPVEFTLQGTVYDKDNGTPVAGADVALVGSSSNGDPVNLKLTTDGNGGFSFDKTQIKPGYTYTIDIKKDKFIGTGDKLSTIGLSASTDFAREYFIIPIPDPTAKGGGIEMPEVRYDFGSADLQVNADVNSKDSLNYLYDIMVKNPNLVVQLESHTDARGSDADNQKLSQGRAQACVDYLVKERGIDVARIKAVGKGETEPRMLKKDFPPLKKGDELTEAYINKLGSKELQEKAHQLNRRTVFRVIGTDYVPNK